jgi:AP2-associated kinase
MHSSKPPILHRDLKVENLLVSELGVYKLCDFGSATTLSSLENIIEEGNIEALAEDINRQTTLQYRAPELVDVSRRMLISEKIDVWVRFCG